MIFVSVAERLLRATNCLSAFAAMAMLSGCATFSVPSGYTLQDKNDEGLAVVSLSYEGLASNEAPTWRYRRLDGEGTAHLMNKWVWEPLDWESPPGRLACFSLPPGQYEFFESGFSRASGGGGMTWTIGPGGVPTNSNPYYAGFNQPTYTGFNAEPFSVKFEIKPGKATYIGSLHFVWQELGRRGTVTLRDESVRDLALLRERLPRIDSAEIENVAPR